MKSRGFSATTRRRSTTRLKSSSRATSSVTRLLRSISETRVQRVIAFGLGKPEATPWSKATSPAIGLRAPRAKAP